jgi:hypothetical protein
VSALDEATRKHLERLAVEAARFAGLNVDQVPGLLALFDVVYTGARAAERADVVAWLRVTPAASGVPVGITSSQDVARLADGIEDECHVGSATNPADCIQVAAQLGRR